MDSNDVISSLDTPTATPTPIASGSGRKHKAVEDTYRSNTTGVVLQLRRVNSMIAVEATQKLQKPRIPMFYDETRGREIENPNHPDYIDALQRYNSDMGQLSINIYYVLGTRVKFVPEGIQRPEDTEWAEELDIVGIDVPPSGSARYLAWLKYYATSDSEIQSLLTAIMTFSGSITEGEVSKAITTFRNNS